MFSTQPLGYSSSWLEPGHPSNRTGILIFFFPKSGLWEPGSKSIIYAQAMQLAQPDANPSFASFWR